MRKGARRSLLSSGNWNNTDNAGVDYLNSNNVSTNTNRNIGSHLELVAIRSELSPEQHFNRHLQSKEGRTHSQREGVLVSKEKTLLSRRAYHNP